MALFLGPLLTGPSMNDWVFAGLVTLPVAGVMYLLGRMGVLPGRRPILRLGPDGLSITALGIGAIPWSAIRRVRISETPAHIASTTPTIKPRLVEIWTDDDAGYRRRMPPLRQLFTRADQGLGAALVKIYPDSLTMAAKDMIAAFRQGAPRAAFEGLELLDRETSGGALIGARSARRPRP